jgi:hypothetical protein
MSASLGDASADVSSPERKDDDDSIEDAEHNPEDIVTVQVTTDEETAASSVVSVDSCLEGSAAVAASSTGDLGAAETTTISPDSSGC